MSTTTHVAEGAKKPQPARSRPAPAPAPSEKAAVEPAAVPAVQRHHLGSVATQPPGAPPIIQAKLQVGPTDDRYEQEADRVADQVMRMATPSAEDDSEEEQTGGAADRVMRMPATDQEDDSKEDEARNLAGPIRRLASAQTGDGGFPVAPNIEARMAASRGGGAPLPGVVRDFMEPRFGADFSRVRVHSGSDAADLNRHLHALAFTHGQDIYLGEGQYQAGRAIGQHLLAHELTHTIQQGATGSVRGNSARRGAFPISRASQAENAIQRALLSPDQIITALTSIPYVSEKLRKNAYEGRASYHESMLDHVTRAVNKYNEKFAERAAESKSAMHTAQMLAIAIDGVTRILCQELFDPFIQPKLAAKLWELYQSDIREKLAQAQEAAPGASAALREERSTSLQKAMNVTGILVERNPVADYMHNELRPEVAADRVRQMATKARETDAEITDDTMLEMLQKRFEAEIGSLTREQVTRTQHAGTETGTVDVPLTAGWQALSYLNPVLQRMNLSVTPSKKQVQVQVWGEADKMYSIREAHGELSTRYLKWLVRSSNYETDNWWTGERLALSDAAVAHLAKLGNCLHTLAAAGPYVPRAGLTSPKQEQHLREIEEREASVPAAGAAGAEEAAIAEHFEKIYAIDKAPAKELMQRVAVYLRNEVPLTITRSAGEFFGGTSSWQAGFSRWNPLGPRPTETVPTEIKAVTADPKKSIKASELFPGKGSANDVIPYLGKWQDRPGYEPRGEYYRIFRHYKDRVQTALLDFDESEFPVFGAANLGWKTTRGTDDPSKKGTPRFGSNYYGNTTFVLNRDQVRNRVVYTATDHGVPHRDPVLALYDFVKADSVEKSATKLKTPKRPEMVFDVVTAAVTGAPVWSKQLMFETQIFGRVDLTSDVEAIYMANDVPEPMFQLARDFQKDRAPAIRTVERIGTLRPNNLPLIGGELFSAGLGPVDQTGRSAENLALVKQFRVDAGAIVHMPRTDDAEVAAMQDALAALKDKRDALKNAGFNQRCIEAIDHLWGVLTEFVGRADADLAAHPSGSTIAHTTAAVAAPAHGSASAGVGTLAPALV
jgi:hypothetical protein